MGAKRRILAFGCLGLLLTACSERGDRAASTPTAVAPRAVMGGVAAENPQARPFSGSMRGIAHWIWTSQCPDQPVKTLTDAAGEVAHLGRATITASHCASADGQSALGGQFTFTAANGDELSATYTAHVVRPAPAEARCEGIPMCFAEQGVMTVTGGTGRFAHATGSIGFTIGVYPTEMPPTIDSRWPALLVFDGTVAY